MCGAHKNKKSWSMREQNMATYTQAGTPASGKYKYGHMGAMKIRELGTLQQEKWQAASAHFN